MKVLVTGATGLIGKATCQWLAREGHETVVLSRRPESVPGIKAYGWNPEVEVPPMEVWEEVEAVIHLAGEPVAGKWWTSEQKRRIRDSRVVGTQNLVAGMRQSATRPKVFISSSAVGFYGHRGDASLDELSPAGKGYLSDVCVEWEREAMQAREFGVRVALLRIGMVLATEGGALEKMLLPFKLGVGGNLGDGKQWFPWIHQDDIVGLIRHVLFEPTITGPVNGVAPGLVNNAGFTKALAAALHRPAIFPMPEFALQMLMGEMAAVVLASQRVMPGVALATNYKYRYPKLAPALDALLK